MPFFEWKRNGRPAGQWLEPLHQQRALRHDYYNRTGTAKSNMFDNKPTETQYFYTDDDSAGARLDGNHNYEVAFAPGQEPPVSGFWSMTLYNDEHFFHPNDLKRYSLGTKNKNLRKAADGSLTLYVGAKSPGADKETNWLPAPKGHSRSTSAPTGASKASSTARGSPQRSWPSRRRPASRWWSRCATLPPCASTVKRPGPRPSTDTASLG